jgi:hypothetical protein
MIGSTIGNTVVYGKEKDKDRRRKDDRREYVRDPRKNDYYYGRYEEDYENESRSRASSRSDSMHDSYRDRGHDRDRRDRRHREKDRHRRHRDPFNPYMQAGVSIVHSKIKKPPTWHFPR